MIQLSCRGVLLDIEGTTSSLSFVHDVMFPFVRRELERFLVQRWDDPDVISARDQIARDAGHESWNRWARNSPGPIEGRRLLTQEITRQMGADVKATGLKALQGLIWDSGFRSGELRSHVFDDVPPMLDEWCEAGLDLRIYSSGSIAAQKLFFGHTVAGNLLPRLRGHYDTTTGPKKEPASYQRIAGDFGITPAAIVFASDLIAELDAARAAGLQTILLVRPGNPPSAESLHPTATSFRELRLRRVPFDSSP